MYIGDASTGTGKPTFPKLEIGEKKIKNKPDKLIMSANTSTTCNTIECNAVCSLLEYTVVNLSVGFIHETVYYPSTGTPTPTRSRSRLRKGLEPGCQLSLKINYHSSGKRKNIYPIGLGPGGKGGYSTALSGGEGKLSRMITWKLGG